MEYTEDIEEWQHIEKPQSPETSRWRNTLLINQNYINDPPPTPRNHQGTLQILPITTNPHDETSSSPLLESSDHEAATPVPVTPPSDWRLRVADEGKKLLKLRFEAMRAGVVNVASRVRDCTIYTGAFWSITYVTGVTAAAVLVSLVYVGIRRRRRRVDHWVYLLRDKDEKIRQLLLQIAELNEVLSSRRKVQVHRIGSS